WSDNGSYDPPAQTAGGPNRHSIFSSSSLAPWTAPVFRICTHPRMEAGSECTARRHGSGPVRRFTRRQWAGVCRASCTEPRAALTRVRHVSCTYRSRCVKHRTRTGLAQGYLGPKRGRLRGEASFCGSPPKKKVAPDLRKHTARPEGLEPPTLGLEDGRPRSSQCCHVVSGVLSGWASALRSISSVEWAFLCCSVRRRG